MRAINDYTQEVFPAKADRASSFLGDFQRYVRWPDWALSRIPMLCMVGSYLGVVHGQASSKFLADFLLFTFVFAAANSAFGFLVNDLGDREVDRRQGKRNTFLDLGTTKGVWLLAAVTAVMLLSSLRFLDRPGFALLWALWALASVTYSLPPLRLKERGAAGILISSLAQWSLPILIAFAALETGTSLERWMFILATTASGVTLELAHQRHDLPNDAQTGTLTLAARLGQSQVDKLYSCTLWLDRAAIGAIVSAVIIGPPPLIFKDHFFGFLAGLPLLFVYLAALWDTVVRVRSGIPVDPHYGERTTVDRILHDTLPNLFVPVFLLVRLTWVSPIFLIALVSFLVWRLWLPRSR